MDALFRIGRVGSEGKQTVDALLKAASRRVLHGRILRRGRRCALPGGRGGRRRPSGGKAAENLQIICFKAGKLHASGQQSRSGKTDACPAEGNGNGIFLLSPGRRAERQAEPGKQADFRQSLHMQRLAGIFFHQMTELLQNDVALRPEKHPASRHCKRQCDDNSENNFAEHGPPPCFLLMLALLPPTLQGCISWARAVLP